MKAEAVCECTDMMTRTNLSKKPYRAVAVPALDQIMGHLHCLRGLTWV